LSLTSTSKYGTRTVEDGSIPARAALGSSSARRHAARARKRYGLITPSLVAGVTRAGRERTDAGGQRMAAERPVNLGGTAVDSADSS
jgi:hypothetical protein